MKDDIKAYHDNLSDDRKQICDVLFSLISSWPAKSTSKIWHGHPVWLTDGNPIVGYSSQKILYVFCFGAVSPLHHLG